MTESCAYGATNEEPRLTLGLALLVMAFGVVAVVPAMIFEAIGSAGTFIFASGGTDFMTVAVTVLIAPVVEEVVKPLGLYLAHFDLKPSLTLKQWAILGFLAGLAFALFEDFLYVFIYAGPGMGVDGMLAIAITRIHVPVHMLCTTITGFGVGMWHQTKRGEPLIAALAFAIMIHAFWNSMILG